MLAPVALFLAVPLLAQEPVFRAESALALVSFHVAHKGRLAEDLRAEDVILLEDGKPQQLAVFEGGRQSPRTLPIEMVLLFDTSGSVRAAGLLDAVAYRRALLDRLPGVRLSVYCFTDKLQMLAAPTRDPAALAAALQRVQKPVSKPEGTPLVLPRGRKGAPATWLFEAMMAAAQAASSTPDQATRMLVVFSDGFYTTNTRPEDAAAALSGLGVAAYPVVLGHASIAAMKESGQLGWPAMAEMLMADFARTAELTGGRSFDPPAIDVGIVRQILSALAAQAAGEYVAGFRIEPSAGAPRRHKVEVKLRSKDLGTVRGGVRTITH